LSGIVKFERRAPILVRNDYETKRGVAPTKTIASRSDCTSRCNVRAARRRRPCIIPAITEESYVLVLITVKHSVQQVYGRSVERQSKVESH